MRKKVSLSAIYMLLTLVAAAAQTRNAEYLGRYVFPWENQSETLEIALRSDSILVMFSPAGEIPLKYVEKDRFEFPQYGGIVVFQRDEKKQITACLLSVAALNVNELKALKQ